MPPSRTFIASLKKGFGKLPWFADDQEFYEAQRKRHLGDTDDPCWCYECHIKSVTRECEWYWFWRVNKLAPYCVSCMRNWRNQLPSYNAKPSRSARRFTDEELEAARIEILCKEAEDQSERSKRAKIRLVD